MNNTSLLKQLLLPYNVGHKKIRIGPKYDGGYVVSEKVLHDTKAVYSLGIGTECDFDLELANLNYPIFMYESNFSEPPKKHCNFHYKQMFISANLLEKEIVNNNHTDTNLLLAMDIEGGEYNFFLNINENILQSFKQIVFEVHDVLYNPNIIPILQKLNKNYSLIHLHANNNCIRDGAFSSGIQDGVPNVLELTYVHNSSIENNFQQSIWNIKSPIQDLDFKNQIDLPEVELNWWLN